MKPHKHAELIKAWADGAEIESFNVNKDKWEEELCPVWQNELTYRIKPEPKPDVVVYLQRRKGSGYDWTEYTCIQTYNPHCWQIKIIEDGETGELKSAEVLK